MVWKRVWQKSKRLKHAGQGCHVRDICSREAFRSILIQERARSDRNFHTFCLAVFQFRPEPVAPSQLQQVTDVLLSRKRFTDVAGWLSETEVGVFLPDTAPSGAQTFIHDVREALKNRGFALTCRLLTYPPETSGRRQQKDPCQLHAAYLDVRLERPLELEDDISMPDDHSPRGRKWVDGLAEFSELIAVRPPAWKRGLDIVGALVGLTLLSPLFLLVAVYIKIVSPGPVFFNQERVGFGGHLFKIWKFRTMRVEGDVSLHHQHVLHLIREDKPLTKLDQIQDPRIIPCGRILRITSVDELPQLFNVLRGDMSLIGPRPDMPYAAEQYALWNCMRFDAMPGMTGLWQVSGKNRTTHTEMVRLDINYTRKQGLLMDMRILIKTLSTIVGEVRVYLRRGSREQITSEP